MKKFVLAATVAAFAAMPAASAFAEASGAGCGAGTIIFKGQQGILPQTLAATTNGSFANQLFGMSSGTLGCETDGVVMNEHEKALYAEANFDNLKQDMAKGQGEYLSTLAALIGVDAADQDAFAALTKQRFSALVGPEVTSGEFLARLDEEMAATPALSRYVM